jgi:hypothetical protein
MCLSFPSDAFIFTELGVKKVSSAAKVLANDDTWSAGIYEEVEGLPARQELVLQQWKSATSWYRF